VRGYVSLGGFDIILGGKLEEKEACILCRAQQLENRQASIDVFSVKIAIYLLLSIRSTSEGKEDHTNPKTLKRVIAHISLGLCSLFNSVLQPHLGRQVQL
jgi:hypothetical protein